MDLDEKQLFRIIEDEPESGTQEASHQPDTMRRGELIAGKYALLDLVGEGGMGKVYTCTAVGFETPLAIKLLKPELADDATSRKRFESEARVASELDHGNTVNIYDFGITDDGKPYLVMDFADGENLSDILKKSRSLGFDRFIQIFSQICDVLHYAHERGVVHRDIKPSNIIVTKDGYREVVKIVDFGIAKQLPRGADASSFNLTETGDIFGTPKYMSPEQCQGHKLDRTADIYSLGCVMYEALAGYPAYEGENAVQVIVKHITEKPKRIVKEGHEVLPGLQDVIMRCLEKNPLKRWPTAGALGAELRRLQNSNGERRRGSRKAAKAAVIAIALLLPIAVCIFTMLQQQPTITPAAVDEKAWRMYQDAGTKAYDADRFTEAEAMWTSALQEAEKFSNNDMRLATTLHDLGQLKDINRDDYTTAEKLFERCLTIRRANLNPNDRDMADIYGHLGAVKGELKKNKEADELLDKAIKIASKSDKTLANHYQDMKARALIDRGDYKGAEAIRKMLFALAAKDDGELSKPMAEAVENLGYLYALQNQYDKAIPLYKRAEKIREETANNKELTYAWLLDSLANSYAEKGELTPARSYYLKAVKAYEDLENPSGLGDAYNSLAKVLVRKGNDREATQYFERAAEVQQGNAETKPGTVAEALGDLALNYVRTSEFEKARMTLAQLQKLADKRGDSALSDAKPMLGSIQSQMKEKQPDIAQTAQVLLSKAK